jgi:hypothetical protein
VNLESSVYAYGALIVVTLAVFISIFSQSILSFGYFIFAMIMIYNSRFFLVDPESAIAFERTLWVLAPYIMLEMLLLLVC